MSSHTLHLGNCLAVLPTLAAGSVQTCVTSPPYFGLRDYGHPDQIGLEPTPDAFVAAMVAVFREVRRVLRDDGTLWLNLGDSYAASGHGGNPSGSPFTKQASNRGSVAGLHVDCPRVAPDGLKPKDLIGIPWRVALALQQPYYSGTIKDERDRIWLAAMLDAEGCMFIHKRKAGQSNGQGYERKNDTFSPGVEIANTSLAIIERVHKLVGKGSICSQSPDQNNRRKQTIYRWNLRTTECRDFVRELYPYLVGKQQQARILYGCPSSGERAEAAHAGLMALHRTGLSDVDFPAPETMFEKGYYLRQDIIWSKCNPMPESVTDRCTKAHEYIFLLSKNERYFYDHEAMQEPAATGWNGSTFDGERDLAVRPTTGRQPRFGGSKYGDSADPKHATKSGNEYEPTGTRNRRSVWTVPTRPFKGAHFATFPPALITPCVLAGSPAGGVVLDPFNGAGTTGVVAVKHGRRYVGIELNPEYLAMSEKRIAAEVGLFHGGAA